MQPLANPEKICLTPFGCRQPKAKYLAFSMHVVFEATQAGLALRIILLWGGVVHFFLKKTGVVHLAGGVVPFSCMRSLFSITVTAYPL